MSKVKDKVTRKLRAILSADVKGYSLLMADDEADTVRKLEKYRASMFDLINSHSGRVVDAVGDNLLAEFSSAVDAVQCSVNIQKNLHLKNKDLPEERRLLFRIGINIGDVIQEGERIFGSGVNVAARIETLAEPGGVCISRNTYDQIKEKLDYGFQYLGDHKVKNIKDPVRVYKVLMDPEDAGKRIGVTQGPKPGKWMWAAVVTAVIALTISGHQLYLKIYTPQPEPASIDHTVDPLPAEPSIAVLPFDNMSGNPDQQYFTDGLTEQIITSLSKAPYLFVMARQSSFAFREKQMTVQQIAKELQVDYVLEGSVQRSGQRIRINAQLIDARSGHHLWAENYDRDLIDIFALQDDIAINIMAALQMKLTSEQLGDLAARKTSNFIAYEKFLIGFEHLMSRTVEGAQQAKKLAEEAIALDPDYSGAYQLLARAYLDEVWYYRAKSVPDNLNKVEELIRISVDLTGQDATTHYLLGIVYYFRRQYDKAVEESLKAVELSPSSANANFCFGRALRYAGRFDDAIHYFKKAIRLTPIATPLNYQNNLAWAHLFAENYEDAISLWNKAIQRNPDYLFAYMGLTLAYQLSGEETKARKAAAEVMRLKPDLTIDKIRKGPATRNVDRERMFQEMKKAGIPE